MANTTPSIEQSTALYIAPKELVHRWCCSRTHVDRIARRAGLTRLCLGMGKNGMVRYIRQEVEALEARSHVQLSA